MNKQEILTKHYEHAMMVIKSESYSNAHAGMLDELMRLHEYLGMGHVDNWCGGCKMNMVKKFYRDFVPTVTIDPDYVKVTMPKHKRARIK